MSTYTTSIRVSAPQELVFDALADLDRAPERISGIRRVERLTDGPVGKGTRWRETRIMFGKEATEELEMTSFDPPRGYTVDCESCGCVYSSTFRVRPEGRETVVELEFTGRGTNILSKVMGAIMGPLMKRAMLKCINQDLADLKAFIETGGKAQARPQPA